MSRPVLAAILLLATSLSACGGDDPAWTPATVCREVSARICAGLVDCGCRFDVRAYDADGCIEARTTECTDGFGGGLGAELAAGRLAFADAAVTACLDDLQALAAACALAHTASQLPRSCDGIVIATAALGAPCGLDGLAFCADGAGLCLPPDAGGTCEALPAAGELCLAGQCAPGLRCREIDEGRCGAPGAVSAACARNDDCDDALICTPAGACAAPGGAAAPCDDTLDCTDGLACVDGACAAGPATGDACAGATCSVGDACGRDPEARTCGPAGALDDACASGTCGDGLACGFASMQCEALPGLDAPCLDGAGCADGLACDFSTTTCVALPGAGAACLSIADRRCAADLGCRESDQTCQPPSVATSGQPCLTNGSDYLCAPGLGCDFAPDGSICVPVGGADAACTNDRVCGPGTYCEFSTLLCTADLADGAACNDGNECGDGSECAPGAGAFACAPIPGRDQPCFEACAGADVCQGAGGACVAELCVMP